MRLDVNGWLTGIGMVEMVIRAWGSDWCSFDHVGFQVDLDGSTVGWKNLADAVVLRWVLVVEVVCWWPFSSVALKVRMTDGFDGGLRVFGSS